MQGLLARLPPPVFSLVPFWRGQGVLAVLIRSMASPPVADRSWGLILIYIDRSLLRPPICIRLLSWAMMRVRPVLSHESIISRWKGGKTSRLSCSCPSRWRTCWSTREVPGCVCLNIYPLSSLICLDSENTSCTAGGVESGYPFIIFVVVHDWQSSYLPT